MHSIYYRNPFKNKNMKLPIIFLSLFLLPLFCISQINTSIDFVGGIDYSYRNMKTVKNSSFSDSLIVRLFDEDEIGKTNFRIGFNFNKRISKNTFFKTGIRFVSTGYQRKYDANEFRWGNQQTGGVFNPDLPGDLPTLSKLIYNYTFIEIPLVVRYEFSQKKFTPFVELGVAPSLFLKGRTKFVDNDGKVQTNEYDPVITDFSQINFVGVLSFGGNFNVNEGLQFFVQPAFRYHFTRLFKEGSVKEFLWNAGLEIGIRKRLK